MPEQLAPKGIVWWCPECGRISADRDGKHAITPGWNQQCQDNAMPVYEEGMITNEQGRVLEATLAHVEPYYKKSE